MLTGSRQPVRYEFPGFVDVHVHFREPGGEESETIGSGLEAARRGGIVGMVTMPNTMPACDSVAAIRRQIERYEYLFPSACITKGRLGREISEVEALAEAGAAFFTDDGSYVADARLMEKAMFRVQRLNMAICEHAMLPTDGVIRDCRLARKLGLKTIPASVEMEAIRRDISICRVTGCKLHIQHISTAEGVSLVRDAQKEGLPVTAEATPHHLLLTCEEIVDDDANYKMAPPLGNHEDRFELRKAVKEGALMFATDHAPHAKSKKDRGFAHSANGIVGLETAIPITYGVMVEEEGMSIDAWAEAWWKKPLALLRGDQADKMKSAPKTTVEVGEPKAVDVDTFASLSRNCPYDGMKWRCWPCR